MLTSFFAKKKKKSAPNLKLNHIIESVLGASVKAQLLNVFDIIKVISQSHEI